MSSGANKLVPIKEVMSHFFNGMTLMFGGFGGVGSPPTIINHIYRSGITHMTLIGNDAGFPEIGIGKLVASGRAKKLITSHIGSNPIAGDLMSAGSLEVEFSPQGILAERIRAGGVGLKGIVTEIGVDNSWISQDKKRITINQELCLFEPALQADVSIVYAKKADPCGNLVYDKSARNTNPLVAMAGKVTIAEVEEIVPIGSLNPEEIITPGVFVRHVILSEGVNWQWAWQRPTS